MAKVIFVRHGEPRYDEVKKTNFLAVGHNFGKLTDCGVKQAQKVAEILKKEKADLIISSPFTRSLQTAAIISRIINVKLEVGHNLHEWKPHLNLVETKGLVTVAQNINNTKQNPYNL